jgi:hypothetical protein
MLEKFKDPDLGTPAGVLKECNSVTLNTEVKNSPFGGVPYTSVLNINH